MRIALASFWLAVLASIGCSKQPAAPGPVPQTLAEPASGYGYVPLDGLPVFWTGGDGCLDEAQSGTWIRNRQPYNSILKDLPDISVRLAIASMAADGSLSFGPAKLTAEGKTYSVVLDYVNVETIPIEFFIRRRLASSENTIVAIRAATPALTKFEALAPFTKQTSDSAREATTRQLLEQKYERLTIPIYVGVGLRLTADILSKKAGISLSSLAAIGAAAQAEQITGTLTVQSLGVSGKSVAITLPIPSKLDQTTVENAILSLGSNRAHIYGGAADGDEVQRTPRVVGLYSSMGTDPALINALYSALAAGQVWMTRSCSLAQPNS